MHRRAGTTWRVTARRARVQEFRAPTESRLRSVAKLEFPPDQSRDVASRDGDAQARRLKVPVLIDFIHVSGYLGKATTALHPADPVTAGQFADGQRLSTQQQPPLPLIQMRPHTASFTARAFSLITPNSTTRS